MNFAIRFMEHNKIFIRSLLWLRELLSENRIPNTLFERLKEYTPLLSKNIPDIEMINKYLENDISYLNRKVKLNNQNLNGVKNKRKNLIKYDNIKIVSYQDIIELDSIRDRVFVLHIKAQQYSYGKIYSLITEYLQEPYCYKVKLSSLGSKL